MTDSSTDSLVERLRKACNGHPHAKIAWPHRVLHEAADRIEALEQAVDAFADICDALGCERDNEAGLQAAAALTAKVAMLTEALEWYGERARLARLIHSGGDAARFELTDDGGKRARRALSEPESE